MDIKKICVHNYRSLRHVDLVLPRLAVFAGVNAAGKTNLCDSLDFLSEVYKHGLKPAIERIGGYDSICYRRARRSQGAIEFSVEAVLDHDEIFQPWQINKHSYRWHFVHRFSFKTTSEKIGADFRIVNEHLSVGVLEQTETRKMSRRIQLASFDRSDNEVKAKISQGQFDKMEKDIRMSFRRFILYLEKGLKEFSSTDLALTFYQRAGPPLSEFCSAMSSFRVFQISPRYGREPGVPIPEPELGRFGSSLPTIMAYFRDKHPKIFQKIVAKIRTIVPELEGIEVHHVLRKQYGLRFKEKDISRYWASEDISDGTIQILAMLVAVLDPRSKLTAIEEPENSVHPWILSNFLETCREAAREKYVLLTTHSISLIDALRPEELFVVYKEKGETKVLPALQLDKNLQKLIEEGRTTLGEYLLAGGISKAVPTGEPN